MTTRDVAGKTVQVNDEGFMTDPNEWDKEIAVVIASEEGITEMTDEHWKVIDYCRDVGMESGSAPTLRNITNGAGVSTKELFGLFPKGPAKKVAKISGLGKPEGCV
ncbi:TusE/DsrC/DsvC family sulfur relay protein [Chloroflexota bacterium]